MKISKKLMAMTVALFTATAFTACASDKDGENTDIGVTASEVFHLSSTQKVLASSFGTDTIMVYSATEPTITASAPWLTATLSSQAPMKYIYTINADTYLAEDNPREATLVFSNGSKQAEVTVQQTPASAGGTITATARDVAKNMYPGWNLGNTLEGGDQANNDTNNGGLGAETAWQPSKTTKALIDLVKASGFRSVRIPTAWVMGHITDASGTKIDAAWLNRVKEIVDYCINDGLYVILNDHWDGGWIEVLGFSKTSASYEKVDDATVAAKAEKLKTLWTQIASAFRDYDEHLIFAGLNEPFQEYNLFSKHHEELTPILEKYNQAFVDAVRATGGKNTTRVLVVQGPSANIESTCKYLHMPTDQVSGKLMVEVHNYSPYDLCMGSKFYYWGEGNYISGNEHNATYYKEADMAKDYSLLRTTFVDKGYPVIVGECAALWRDLGGQAGESQDKHDASIKAWYYQMNKVATDNGCVNMAWDTNSTNRAGVTGTSTIFDRSAVKVFNTHALNGIMEGCQAGQWPY